MFQTEHFTKRRYLHIVTVRLGCVVDVDIDVCDGKVLAIIIPVPGKICGILGSDGEYVIPFGCIKKIGPDIILVEICEEKFLQKY